VKLKMLRNTKNLAGSQIKVDENLSLETRKIRSLIPYLKDIEKNRLHAFL
jgi:hypothetical protein